MAGRHLRGHAASGLGALGRVAAAIVALAACAGLVVQFEASFAQLGSVAVTLWVQARYFTIIGNLLVALLFIRLAIGRGTASASVMGGITLTIALVGIVYALLLRGLVRLSDSELLANLLLHQVTPVLVPLFWLAFVRKGRLRRSDPLLWFLLPALYFVYALIRGGEEGSYAYPFLDLGRIGWEQTAVNAAAIAAGFLAVAYALVWLDGAMGGVRRG